MKIIKNSCDGAYSSLDVRFTKQCDNNCSFCIEKTGIDSLGKPDVQNMIESTINSGIKDVLILGGEPFLYPDELFEYVSTIRDKVNSIYVTTSLPSTFIKNTEKCYQIIRLIDGLNVSVQHTNWMRNNSILNASAKINRLEILRKLNKQFASKIRTSINLVKYGIDNKIELLRTLNHLQSLGCKHVKINELQSSDLYVSFEKITKQKMKSPYSNGCQSEIKMDGIDMKLTLKRSCFVVEKSNFATVSDIFKIILKKFIKPKNKFRVMYENGKIEYGWLKK